MNKYYNVHADNKGSFQIGERTIEYEIRWVKDLVSEVVQIDEILEVHVLKNENEDQEYYDDHRDKVDDLIIEDATKHGEPEFDESRTWQDMQECFAEIDKEE